MPREPGTQPARRPPAARGGALLLLAASGLAACRAAAPSAAPAGPSGATQPPAPTASSAATDIPGELRAAIDSLYRAFCFDAGGEPDWAAQRALFHPDCRFLGPMAPGREPRSEDLEQFLESFRRYATGSERSASGLHERILWIEAFRFGGLAQTAVAFEGHLPGSARAETRGLDTLQWVETPAGWRVVGFASQYERPGLLLPPRPGRSAAGAPRD